MPEVPERRAPADPAELVDETIVALYSLQQVPVSQLQKTIVSFEFPITTPGLKAV